MCCAVTGQSSFYCFFFSSRRRHTRYIGDWSSDVCSSDLYYFYFLDEELGLGYVRVPTWLPYRLQVYFNGHNWLAAQLKKRDIVYRMLDNAFVEIDDWAQAQRIADGWQAKRIHWKLDELAKRIVQ